MRGTSHHLVVASLILLCVVGAVTRAPPPMRPPVRTLPQRPARPRGAVVCVNTASLDELATLPGIGRVTARAIVDARPFASVDDLRRVRGIGPARLRRILPFVTVR